MGKLKTTKENCYHCTYWGINYCLIKKHDTMFWEKCSEFKEEGGLGNG